jgi:hypothetical protein
MGLLGGQVIPKYLYPEEWYNGDPFTTDELNYVLHVNRLVQAPRLRQLRVNKQDCAVPPRLRKILSVCYPSFSPENENKTGIAGWPPGEMLEYRTDQQLQTSRYNNGLLPYGGGGFALDIPLYFNKTQSLEFFTYLKENKWTDLHTRAVFFDFVLYNPDNGLYLSVRLLFEFLPYGQVRPSSQFRAMRLGFSTLKVCTFPVSVSGEHPNPNCRDVPVDFPAMRNSILICMAPRRTMLRVFWMQLCMSSWFSTCLQIAAN